MARYHPPTGTIVHPRHYTAGNLHFLCLCPFQVTFRGPFNIPRN